MRTTLTKRIVATAQPKDRPYEFRDAQVRGLLFRVQPSGHKAWIVTWAHGKRRTLGSAGHLSLDEARELARKIMSEFIQTGLRAIAKPKLPQVTLEALLDDHYAPWARTELKGADKYVERIKRVFASGLSKPVSAINGAWVERWWTERLQSKTRPGAEATITKATAWRDLASLRSVLSKAVKWGVLDANPLIRLRMKAAQPRSVVRFLSAAEEGRLRQALRDRDASLAAARASANEWRAARKRQPYPEIPAGAYADHLAPVVLLAMNTGLRRGELLALEWSDINLDARMLTVQRENAKSGKQRHVPLNVEALAVLKQWASQTADAGSVFGVASVKSGWGSLMVAARLVDFRFHDLRHHFASRLVMAGVDLNTVRELLGHADLTMLRWPVYHTRRRRLLERRCRGSACPPASAARVRFRTVAFCCSIRATPFGRPYATQTIRDACMQHLESSRIGIIGLGYVGLPLAVEFGKHYDTLGFDINQQRIDELRTGRDRTLEVDAAELAASPRLRFSAQLDDLRACNVYIVTVPTPIDSAKRPDLTPLIRASETLGKVLKRGDIVVYESTVYPGCTEEVCVPLLANGSGLLFNRDFFAGYSPERINPGDKQHRVTSILKVTSGSTAEAADFVDRLYGSIITAGTHKASCIKVAEAAKVIENTQRDLNIALVNDLAILFNKLGIDTLEVLQAAGTKWNFLPFRPGLVGGHCISVDPYYLTHKAQEVGHHPDVILAGRRTNDSMGPYIASEVIRLMVRKGINPVNARVLLLGLAFKENCPDLRNTRVVDIMQALCSYNAEVDVHDPWVSEAEAEHEYGITPIAQPTPGRYDAVIVAVGHRQFVALGAAGVRAFGKPASVVYDVKYVLPRDAVDGRL